MSVLQRDYVLPAGRGQLLQTLFVLSLRRLSLKALSLMLISKKNLRHEYLRSFSRASSRVMNSARARRDKHLQELIDGNNFKRALTLCEKSIKKGDKSDELLVSIYLG